MTLSASNCMRCTPTATVRPLFRDRTHTVGGRACSRLQYSTAQTRSEMEISVYASPITSDVLGYLTEVEVVTLLHQIARLPSNAYCTHARNYDDDEE